MVKKLATHELSRLTPEAFKAKAKTPLVIVLDNIRSMYNVGAIFRIADAFLIEKIYLCGITAIPPRKEIHKTALGAEEAMAWAYAKDTLDLLKQLKNQGYIIIAAEQTNESVTLPDFLPDSRKKYGIVLGHEVSGISEAALSVCDVYLEIPQYGTKHSLNVAVSAGIFIWELFTKLRFQN